MTKSRLLLSLALLLCIVSTSRATERTLLPPRDYVGNLYVLVTIQDPTYNNMRPYSIVWGPWIGTATAGYSPSFRYVLQFKKTQRDQVPFTVYAPQSATISDVTTSSPCSWTGPSSCNGVTLNWSAR